jgi:pimeloyl-ACP methyl ester carboxylesterase
MREPIMKKVRGDGVEIQLAIWEGEGKEIFAVHGLTANCRCWDAVAAMLTPHHQVLAMDLRGRGRSAKPPSGYSIETHGRDVLRLLDRLGLDRVVLMGHSLGAFISLAFAAQNPGKVGQLILIDGGGKLSPEQTAKVMAAIKISLARLGKVFPSYEAYVEMLGKAPFLQPWSSALDTYFHYEVEEANGEVRSRVLPGAIREDVLSLTEFDASKFYSRIQCPVLILRATEGVLSGDDLLLPEDVVQRMVREIPRARRVDVEGTNHYSILFQNNPSRDRTLLQFLAEGEESG